MGNPARRHVVNHGLESEDVAVAYQSVLISDEARLVERATGHGYLADPQHAAVAGLVGGGAGEVVEGALGDVNQVLGDERGSFGGALDAVLVAAFPFKDGPGVVAGGGEAGEDLFEIDLAVAQGAESAGAVLPVLEAAVDAGAGRGAELGVLHVEGFDVGGVDVDEADVVHALQDEMRGVVVDVDAGVVSGGFEEAFKGGAVVGVLAGVEFVGEVDAVLVGEVEDGLPAAREFGEGLFDEAGWPG